MLDDRQAELIEAVPWRRPHFNMAKGVSYFRLNPAQDVWEPYSESHSMFCFIFLKRCVYVCMQVCIHAHSSVPACVKSKTKSRCLFLMASPPSFMSQGLSLDLELTILALPHSQPASSKSPPTFVPQWYSPWLFHKFWGSECWTPYLRSKPRSHFLKPILPSILLGDQIKWRFKLCLEHGDKRIEKPLFFL